MTKNFAKDKHQSKCEDVVKNVNQEQGQCVRNIGPIDYIVLVYFKSVLYVHF